MLYLAYATINTFRYLLFHPTVSIRSICPLVSLPFQLFLICHAVLFPLFPSRLRYHHHLLLCTTHLPLSSPKLLIPSSLKFKGKYLSYDFVSSNIILQSFVCFHLKPPTVAIKLFNMCYLFVHRLTGLRNTLD